MNIPKTLLTASVFAASVSTQGAPKHTAILKIDTDTVLQQTDPRLLAGTNLVFTDLGEFSLRGIDNDYRLYALQDPQ